jgi:recombination protein RecA
VQKSGSYFSFEEERLGQGRQNASAFLREHPDVTQQILQRLQALAGPDQVVSARLLPSAAVEHGAALPEPVPEEAEEVSA